MSLTRLARPLPTLGLFGVGVLLAALGVSQAIDAGIRPRLLADALTIDLVVSVPLGYWFLAVRGAGWPRISVVPVFVLSVAGARLVPGLESGGLLPRIEWVAIPAELLLLTIVARRAVAMSRALARDAGPDALESLRRAAIELVDVERAAEIIAYEAAVLWYAVAGGGKRGAPVGESFGVRRRSGYGPVLLALFLAIAVEAIALHLFVRQWSVVAAWILTGLTAYAVVWLIGDFRALGSRTILLTDDELVVRLGLRWTVRIPLGRIRAVCSAGGPVASAARPARGSGHLRAVILGSERQIVELDGELPAVGFYGIRRRVRSIGLAVDEPGRFLAAVGSRIGPRG
ncbi:MAG TPA: hypothetical protein VIE68_12185 [Gemmatimonadota bacterium]